jgi:hypothetical protein
MIQPVSDPWVEHTFRAFGSSLLIHPPLKDCKYIFRHAPPTVEIDIIRIKTPTDRGLHFQLHHRWLDFTQAHQYRQSCPLWQARQVSAADKDAVCDCAAEKLFDLVLNEIEELSGGERQKLGNLCKDLLNSMPRHVSAESQEVVPGRIDTEITWDTSTSKHFKTSFDVFIYASDYGSVAKPEHRFHDLSDPATGGNDFPLHPPDNNVSSTTQATSQSVPDDSSAESSPEASRDDLNPPTGTDYLWRGKAEHSRSITIKCPHSTLSPGKKYVALIRPTEECRSFYSAPFLLEIQCPSPQNVQAKKVGSEIHVTWDFPFDINVEYRVICESMFDTHHRSVLLEKPPYSFEVDLDVLSEELEVTVEATSEDGLESSRSIPAKIPAEAIHTTSPSEESDDDFEDGGGFDSPGWYSRSPSVQTDDFEPNFLSSWSNIRESITVQKRRITAPGRYRSFSQKKLSDRPPSDLPPQSSATKSNAQAGHSQRWVSTDLNASQKAAAPSSRISTANDKDRVSDAVGQADLKVVSKEPEARSASSFSGERALKEELRSTAEHPISTQPDESEVPCFSCLM